MKISDPNGWKTRISRAMKWGGGDETSAYKVAEVYEVMKFNEKGMTIYDEQPLKVLKVIVEILPRDGGRLRTKDRWKVRRSEDRQGLRVYSFKSREDMLTMRKKGTYDMRMKEKGVEGMEKEI